MSEDNDQTTADQIFWHSADGGEETLEGQSSSRCLVTSPRHSLRQWPTVSRAGTRLLEQAEPSVYRLLGCLIREVPAPPLARSGACQHVGYNRLTHGPLTFNVFCHYSVHSHGAPSSCPDRSGAGGKGSGAAAWEERGVLTRVFSLSRRRL